MGRRKTWVGLALAAVLLGDPAFAQADEEPDGYPRRHATALDLGVYMALGTIWYLIDDVNERDREYDWTFTTLEKKFVTREALRFDDNTFGVNSPGHALAGTLYFLSGRAHGGSTLESAATALVGSAAWELGIEYREVLSINDLITTTVGGVALGESFFQVGEFFRRSKPTLLNSILGAVLIGPSGILPWAQRPPRQEHAVGSDGYPAGMWRRIHIGAGTELARPSASAATRASAFVDAYARTIDLADYGRPGVNAPRWLARPLLAEVHVRAAASPSGFDGLWLSAETIWSGLYSSHLRAADGEMRGVEWLAGLSAIYDYQQWSAAAGGDRSEAVSPAGASGHAALHLGASKLRFDASLYPIFASVHSHAWRGIASDAREGAPEVLQRDGYYFSIGARVAGAVALEWARWRFGVAARGYAFSSAEWMEIPNEASRLVLADRRLSWEASIARELMFGGLVAKIALGNDAHRSLADDASVDGARPSMVLQLLHEL